ncbi:MAG: Gliding motility-associated C-terminal protein [Ferruginibacter sp.]|nr:Gliding motility-associated C-terminal protein [Ferruginibacter sp.]
MKLLCLLIGLILSVYSVDAQTVDFNYTTGNNLFCAPQSVTFTQTATGSPQSFIWNFGNGQTSSSPSQTIIYSPGTYNITLTAIYPGSAISITKTITIYAPPTVTLTADKPVLCQPGTVTFTASSANAVSYEWDFGDGSGIVTTPSATILHGYTNYGSFHITVKTFSAEGCSSTASTDINIAKFPVVALPSVTSGCIPAAIYLTVFPSLPAGDAVQNITWDFGDGSPNVNGSVNSIAHTYTITSPVTTATATITTAQGCTNTASFPTFAFGTPPVGINAYTLSRRDTFCASETISFAGFAPTANFYAWDFGDGQQANVNDTTVTHLYRTLGPMTATVTPYFNGCAGPSATVNIFIRGVVARYSLGNSCTAKSTYDFTNQSLGRIDHFEWRFSDVPGFIDSSNFSTRHTFPGYGSFMSTLNLYDYSSGCTDSLSLPVFTASPSVSVSTTQVCKDSSLLYSINNTYPASSPYAYDFHVNGQLVNTGNTPSLSYQPSQFGTFNDYVVVYDPNAATCNDTLRLPAPVNVRGPVPNFNSIASVCADTAVSVINLSSPYFAADSLVAWRWNFGDNRYDSVKNPLPHTYAGGGIYTISLKVTDKNGCSQDTFRQVTIYSLPPLTVFPARDTICLNDTLQLFGFSTDSLRWSPTTNINCVNCDTVTVRPQFTTAYVATAQNSYGCKATDTAFIRVYRPFKMGLMPLDTSVCKGQPVQFRMANPGITTWSPPDFLSNTGIPNPVAVPDTSIQYKVLVTDSAGCFSDSAYPKITIYPPVTVDAGPDLTLPYNTAFTFTPVYGNNAMAYSWTPAGNLSCTNCANPSGTAVKKQSYEIDVTSRDGCHAKDSITVFVTCASGNLMLPTAFTPNSDGRNDYFYPITRGYRNIKSFSVFDRFGTKVFERRNFEPNVPSSGWDGRIRADKYVNTQTFVWVLEADCDLGGTVLTKGTVTLIH